LRLLSEDGYVVQSADWIQFPLSVADIASHELRFCERLIEEAPEVRSAVHPSSQEAIQAFDDEFENAW
jgi:hypothetical protein